MPMFPVPAFVALVLAYLAARTALLGGRPALVVFLTVCALQALLVTLVRGYDLEGLHPVLPVSATLVPPLAWLTFQDALVRRITPRMMAVHGAAPAFTLFCRVFAPETTDVVVPLVFVLYGAAILWSLRDATDMPLARLEAGGLPISLWTVLGWALVASAVSDILIALAFLSGAERWVGWLISLFSSLPLLLLGLLSGAPTASGPEDPAAEAPTGPAPGPPDDDLLAALEALLHREPVHLDPDLTLARLARRLHVPQKRLSAAVNRATGGNVSRYVNSWRIRHACQRMESGATVTDAMLESGFNTKSNFNREFRRVTGTSPREWRRRGGASRGVSPVSDSGIPDGL